MLKIFLLIILKIFLFSYENEEIKYFIDYKENGQIKTKTIVEQHYNYLKENLEDIDRDNQLIWTYENKDYKIVDVYNNIKDLEQLDKERNEKKLKQENEKIQEQEKEKTKENTKNIFTLIIVLIIVYILYKKIKNRKPKTKEIYIEKEEKIEIEKVKTIVKKEQKKEIKTEKIKEEKIEKNLDFNDLEKIRVSLFKMVKYDKNTTQTRKKELYTIINDLKIEILKKENLEEINKKINELSEELKNG